MRPAAALREEGYVTAGESSVVEKIRLILSQPEDSRVYSVRFTREMLFGATTPVVCDPGDVEIVSERAKTLRRFYSSLPEELASAFPRLLLAEITRVTAEAVVAALVDMRHIQAIISFLQDRPATFGDELIDRIFLWNAVSEALSKQSHRFVDDDLAQLQSIANDEASWVESASSRGRGSTDYATLPVDYRGALTEVLKLVTSTIGRIKYLKLQNELQGNVNAEINADKETLVTLMESFGFRPAISQAIQELDRSLQAAGTRFDFSGCMRLARTIFEEIVEDCARRGACIAQYESSRSDGKDNFRPWKEVLIRISALNGPEGILLQALYDYLSNTAVHRLESAPEQARIARNMMIECGLLVVRRLEGLSPHTSPPG